MYKTRRPTIASRADSLDSFTNHVYWRWPWPVHVQYWSQQNIHSYEKNGSDTTSRCFLKQFSDDSNNLLQTFRAVSLRMLYDQSIRSTPGQEVMLAIHERRKLGHFGPWNPQFWTEPKWLKGVVIIFDKFANTFYFSSTTNRSQDKRGFKLRLHPPPMKVVENPGPTGCGVNHPY